VTGYELRRALETQGTYTLERGGRSYRLAFFGEKTSVSNGLRAEELESGDTRRFRGGWTSEACFNFLTTVETGRWDRPVGPWLNPEQLDAPPLTDWERQSGYGALNTQKWLCADGFVSHSGACSNHARACGLDKSLNTRLTEEEWETLSELPEEKRVSELRRLRGS